MTAPKRFLVVVRAGDQSLHPGWTSDLASRNWDLVVSYFGTDPARFRNAGEIRIDDRGQKYGGLHALFTREDFWRRYDYIWLPDDDLAAEQSTIDSLFETTARQDLAVAQPALSWTSFYSHPVTIHCPSFRVRMTNFVEIMAPCFHRPFLEECLATFTENLSGWGMDWLWPRLLPRDSRRCAVIDEAVVTHTRPVGGPTYTKLRESGVTPQAEARALAKKFGIPRGIRAQLSAAIDRRGKLLDPSKADDAAIIRDLLTRDQAAFEEFRLHWSRQAYLDAATPRHLVYQGPKISWRM